MLGDDDEMRSETDPGSRDSRGDPPRASNDPDSSGTTWPLGPPVFACGNLPRRIGRYIITSEIGAGGMGRVYAARDEQLDREVAVKVVRSGIASASAVERFLCESRLLAQIEHAGIARVYDCGIDEKLGLPYFVMERVPQPRTLISYAHAFALGVTDRLRLFVRVCDAVHAAHRRGIIHRDLKPSNILVSAGAAAGSAQPKVIDFGVAEQILPSAVAGQGGLSGTLEYMSPEQCLGGPVDARSDVYALGIILYEFLCGKLPYSVPGDGLTAESTHIIREQPPKPIGLVDPAFRGDLEAIVQRALEKSPEDRYQTAASLGKDIRRHLDGHPVEARSRSVAYVATRRATSLWKRHAWISWCAVTAVSYGIAQKAGMRFVYEYTPLDKTYAALLTLVPAAARLGPEMFRTAIVTLPEADAVADAAARAGIRVRPDDPERAWEIPTPQSLAPVGEVEGLRAFDLYAGAVRRLLMAKFLDRMIQVRPSVVALDLFIVDLPPADVWAAAFEAERSRSTLELAAAADRLRIEGRRAVVGGLHTWADPSEAAMEMSPGIEESMFWGGLSAAFPPRQVALDLFVNRGVRPPIPSLSLEAFARRDGNVACRPIYVPQKRGVEILYPSATGGPTGVTRTTRDTDRVVIARSDEPVYSGDVDIRGLLPGDKVGMYLTELPEDEFFTNASMTITEALEMPLEALVARLRGRAVVVARVHDGDRHPTDDGRHVPGCWAHAAGMESLLTGKGLTAPNRLESELLVLVGCALGTWMGGTRRRMGLALRWAGLTALAAAAALGAYHFAGYQFNPMVPLISALCAGVLRFGLARLL